ncbi:TetR family transcriptional regulator [Sphingomonas changnyeongensis]|uniref:TetR family transcriptional regulator n=1 Tax=Sphingomonas changnyeongensis TaxID=2698679 RepID=A0A7Z2NVI5_9SPHN|nr:TetR/AcrR family transcriptional regulator [Sphingomonas changnyeongensis]QHL90588.1 TetR family transcriptional regulator [Sphingomonas changnyeongensis]
MTMKDDRRDAAIEAMADHLLTHGLAGASLRPLARAAGTSDRMLLYYFGDKDRLLALTLDRIARRLTAILAAALPPGTRLGWAALLGAVWAGMADPALRPFMHLWLDLAAGAARGTEPQRRIAGAIADLFAAWLDERLDLPEGESTPAAHHLLAVIEGAMLLDALGRPALAEAAIARAAAEANVRPERPSPAPPAG